MAWGLTTNIKGPAGADGADAASPLVAILGSNQSISSTGLVNVPGLSVSVVAGTYKVRLCGKRQHNAAVTMGLGFSGPAASMVAVELVTQATVGAAPIAGPTMLALATLYNVTDVGTASTDRGVFLDGLITFTASGTLQLQAARASGTATIVAGTALILEKVG